MHRIPHWNYVIDENLTQTVDGEATSLAPTERRYCQVACLHLP